MNEQSRVEVKKTVEPEGDLVTVDHTPGEFHPESDQAKSEHEFPDPHVHMDKDLQAIHQQMWEDWYKLLSETDPEYLEQLEERNQSAHSARESARATELLPEDERPPFFNDPEGFKAYLTKLATINSAYNVQKKKDARSRMFMVKGYPKDAKIADILAENPDSVEGHDVKSEDRSVLAEEDPSGTINPFDTQQEDITEVQHLMDSLSRKQWKNLSYLAKLTIDRMVQESFGKEHENTYELRLAAARMIIDGSNEVADLLRTDFLGMITQALEKTYGQGYFDVDAKTPKRGFEAERRTRLHTTFRMLLLQEAKPDFMK